jgi:hypothetical protein
MRKIVAGLMVSVDGVVGHGKRLFGGQDLTVPLTLARSEAFGTGVVHLIYNSANGA